MKRFITKTSVLLMAGALVSGCATTDAPEPNFTPVEVAAGGYALKTTNAVIILDASSSMGESYQEWQKFAVAKATVRNLAATMPMGMGIMSGLRVYGRDAAIAGKHSVLFYGVDTFDRSGFQQALATVTGPGGRSPLADAIKGAACDLQDLGGNHAVIIVSDGKNMGSTPAVAAANAKQTYGDRLCIFPVLVGDDEGGRVLLEEIAAIGGCGTATNADALLDGKQMAAFVTDVFMGKALDADKDGVPDHLDRCPGTPAGVAVDASGCPLDADKDGVPDFKDKCPGTPAGVAVDADGCPLDTDKDGVPDYLDKCPGTPPGVKVDAHGCPITVLDASATTWTFDNINFDVGKADIQRSSYEVLDEIADALIVNPELKVVVEGHTDSTGNRALNVDLSQQRAQAVVDYLVNKGIASSRLSAIGYGPDRPIADNGTSDGRAKNRRVQFTKVD